MRRYFVRVLDTGEAALNQEEVKGIIRKAVYNPRFRTMDEGTNSVGKVLTFTPEPGELERVRTGLHNYFPGRTIVLRLERNQ